MVVFPAPFGPRKPVDPSGLHNEAQIVYGESAVVALDQPVDDDRRHVMINGPPRAPGRANRSGRAAAAYRRLHALRRCVGARLSDTWTWWRICISLDCGCVRGAGAAEAGASAGSAETRVSAGSAEASAPGATVGCAATEGNGRDAGVAVDIDCGAGAAGCGLGAAVGTGAGRDAGVAGCRGGNGSGAGGGDEATGGAGGTANGTGDGDEAKGGGGAAGCGRAGAEAGAGVG